MSWQDIVLTVGATVGVIALIPSIMSEDKPARATSVLNGTILTSFVIVDFSLGLVFASIVTVAAAILWFVLFVQQWQRHHRTPERQAK